jgi:hypothetical protein
MTFPTATKNAMLDGLTVTHASLHTGFPGTTGANEVTGGSYARMAITMSAASGGSRLLGAGVTFAIPACTVRWIGYWNSSTFLGCAPNGGATPKNFISVASSDLVYAPGHAYADTQKIAFFDGTPPASLVEGTTYFVRDTATDTFKVAATSGGAAIDLTAASTFGCVVCAITEDVYGAPDTHALSSTTFTIPD